MKKILIVEDEIGYIQPLQKKLTENGYKVSHCLNGQEGLKTALQEHPDLILLDIMMPVMDGMAVLSELQKDEWGKKAKVILLSNLSDVENIQKALAFNVHDYLVKSNWDLDAVVKLVKQKLSDSPAQ